MPSRRMRCPAKVCDARWRCAEVPCRLGVMSAGLCMLAGCKGVRGSLKGWVRAASIHTRQEVRLTACTLKAWWQQMDAVDESPRLAGTCGTSSSCRSRLLTCSGMHAPGVSTVHACSTVITLRHTRATLVVGTVHTFCSNTFLLGSWHFDVTLCPFQALGGGHGFVVRTLCYSDL